MEEQNINEGSISLGLKIFYLILCLSLPILGGFSVILICKILYISGGAVMPYKFLKVFSIFNVVFSTTPLLFNSILAFLYFLCIYLFSYRNVKKIIIFPVLFLLGFIFSGCFWLFWSTIGTEAVPTPWKPEPEPFVIPCIVDKTPNDLSDPC